MRPLRGDRGQSVVEFALVLPLALLLVVGIVDAARAVWAANALTAAAREGTRYAIVHGAQSEEPSGPGSATFTAPDSDTAVEAVVRARASGLSDVSVSARWPDGHSGRGSPVVVEASAPFTPALSAALLGGGLRITLRAGSTLVIHR
ncbi:MAG: TadE/TadG family type IV pilus assembly protein [Candidatus Limnocylindria bacterium]